MNNLKIIIAGGSGFIGQAMAMRWAEKNEVIILSRMKTGAANNAYCQSSQLSAKYVHWDGQTLGRWAEELDGADLLVNLAGRSVNCRYNEQNKADILNSRIDSTRILGNAVQHCAIPPKLWINGASATIYPHATDTPRDEQFNQFEGDFSVQVCKAWEAAFNEIRLPQTRKAILRMAIVLGKGGVMVPYKRLASLGLGGRQGNGKQMFSWIHIDDLNRMIEWLWQNKEQEGVYNASAMGAVSNKIFMQAVRKAMHIPFGFSAPAWMLKIGAAMIGTEPELLLKSRWVIPARSLKEGFNFQYPKVSEALFDLLGKY